MKTKQAIKHMLISTLAFACMNATVKYLAEFSPFQIVFFRSAGTLIFTLSYLLKHNMPIIEKNNKLMFFRSLAGVTSMTLFFMSIKYLSIGTAISLRYTAPIFAAIFAVLFFKEKVKPLQWLFFFIALFGVVILKGFDSHLNSYGLILVLLSAFFSGLVFILINRIGMKEHPVVIVNHFMIIATIVGGVLSISHWINPVGIQWLIFILLGVFGYFGQVYMTKAFQAASTNLVAPLNYIEVIFTVVLGTVIFNEIYTPWSIFGIILIVVGLVLNILYKGKLKH